MRGWVRWGLALTLALGLGWPLPVRAQAPPPPATGERVRDEIDFTDRRIDLAVTLVAESPSAVAGGEVTLAKDLQSRAKTAFASSNFLIALRATLDARGHADRAVSLVRGLPDPDRVSIQVERTREILDRTRDGLASCDNIRARSLLRVALDMQARAEQADDESRFLAALQLTMSARERAYKAQRLCNIEDSMQDTAARALQRTDDVLARAREVIDAGAPPPAHDQLQRAVALQGQAQAEYRGGQFDSALRLTQNARLMAQHAMRFGPPGPGGPRR